MTEIEIKLAPTNALIRFPCHVCGGCTEKVEVHAEGHDENGQIIRVCEFCLEEGNIDDRLQAHADRLARQAADVRALIGRLKVPTYKEWRDAEATANGRYAPPAACHSPKPK